MISFLESEIGVTVVILVIVLSFIIGVTQAPRIKMQKRWGGKYRVIERIRNDGESDFFLQSKVGRDDWLDVRKSSSAGPCISEADKIHDRETQYEVVVVQ